MRFDIVTKISKTVFATLLLFVILSTFSIDKVHAQTEPEPVPLTPEQCMGQALAEYMNAILDAKGSGPGQIPSNVKLLSPAFNMTSPTFNGIVNGMKSSGADFSRLDGISGNVYNVGGQNISYYLNNVRAAFPGAKFVITETGTFDHSDQGIIDLAAEIEELRKAGDIDAALLFNGLGTNSGWDQHTFTQAQLDTICGGDCAGKKIGFNTANMFGSTPESFYQQAGNKNMTHSLEIADSGQINNTIKGIENSIANGMTPIIRIGVGYSSGGFDNPATYAAFLSEIGNRFPGIEILAIAGPNEPDLEPWLAPECALASIPAGELCAGPVDVDKTWYRGQVIGHQDPSPDGKGPWKIYASATDEKENSSEIVSSVIAEQMIITPTKFWSTDFSTMTQKYIGSLSPTSEDFANTKVESQFKMDTMVPRSPPLYLTSHIPGYIHQGGLQIAPQDEKRGPAESYSAFQARAYPSQDGEKPGLKSTIDNLNFNKTFIGCLQAAVCDPRLDTCLKNDKSGDYCVANVDPPESCIGEGELIDFSMEAGNEVEFLEPADRQAMNKVLWDFSAAVVRKPGDSIPPQRSAILATSMEDYYAQEQELLAQSSNPNTDVFIADVIPTNLPGDENEEIGTSYKIENVNPLNPTKAKAQASPPYEEDQPYCNGIHMLIENKPAENQYSVKVWNAATDCREAQHVDFSYYMEYWVGNKEQGYELAKSCNGHAAQGPGIPYYEPGTQDNREWGMPVESFPGCSIPVTPRDMAEAGLDLKVRFEIPSSSAPYSDNPACVQRPSCTCPEGVCGIVAEGELPPIDCTKCETWAPSGECATMDAEDLLEVTNEADCSMGFCKVTNQEIRLTGEVIETPTPDGNPISVTVDNLFSGIVNIFKGFYSSGAKLFNYHCEESSETVGFDINGNPIEEDKWECTFGERQYLLYGYVPTGFLGKLNQHRSGSDFQVFQAFYKVPGVSDNYFEPEPSKHELDLNLSINGFHGNKEPTCGTNFLSTTLGGLFPGLSGPNTCIDLAIGGDPDRTMYIEYIDHYSQVAQYCLSEAAGSLPTEFPTRALDLCEPFMSSLREGNSFAVNPISGTPGLSSGVIDQIGRDSLNSGVPARLLATILEVEGGNANSCTRNSVTATGPYQITDLTLQDITTEAERTEWNLREWPDGSPQSVYREDGRCDFPIANILAARTLKLKAGVDVRTGTIRENDFETIKRALGGYYGTCSPTPATEGREGWGPGISYCDYGLWRMGLTQYCTNGQLSPTCDNENPEVVQNTTPDEIVKASLFEPVPQDMDLENIQRQLASDLENLLNKYSSAGADITLQTPIEQTPKGFQEELANLERYYRERYAL